MKRIILFILTIAVMFTLTACEEDSQNPATEPNETEDPSLTTNQPDTIKTELTVWSMTCDKCVNKIKKALSELDGIIEVEVDLDEESVTVEHDPELDIDLIKNTITKEGYNIP